MPEKSLGTVGNSIAGAVGGGILPMLISIPGLEGMVGSLVGGGVAGAVVTAVIGMIKKGSKA